MNVQYTSIKNSDVETVLILFNKIYADYYWPNQHTLNSIQKLMHYMNINENLSTVVIKNEKPIGLALIATNDNSSWLYCFGIIPKERAHGYGQQLLNYITQQCKNNSINKMGLEVLLQNKKARRLYYKNSFKRNCYLDSYSVMGQLKTYTYKQYSYEESLTPDALIKIKELSNNKEVWSRRYDTLLKRDINWLTAYYKSEPVAVLAYNNQRSLSFYRLDPLDKFHSERALHTLINLAQINNPQCSRKVAVNINHNNSFENKILSCIGFKRFMRQEYLIRIHT